MTKEQKILLAVVKENKNIIQFMNDVNPEWFVKIHQENIKDCWLQPPPIRFTEDVYEMLDLSDVISEKYNEYFKLIGVEPTYKWLNPNLTKDWVSYLKTEEFSIEEVEFLVNGKESPDFELDDFYQKTSDLYYDNFSDYGFDWFIYEIVDTYLYDKKKSSVNT